MQIAAPPCPSQSLPFRDVPVEIRFIIYRYCFASYQSPVKNWRRQRPGFSCLLAALRGEPFLYNEALGEFFKIITIKISDESLKLFTKRLGDGSWKCIRHLDIHIPCDPLVSPAPPDASHTNIREGKHDGFAASTSSE